MDATAMLYLVITLLIATGLAHSYLGERYLLMRLFTRHDLPKLFGSASFTTGTLRFAWHLTTLVWWGFAYLIFLATQGSLTTAQTLKVIGVVALLSGLFPLLFTRGKHLSWIVFFVAGGLLLAAADSYP